MMTKPIGEDDLRSFSQRAYPKKMHRINERTYYFVGYGHSNCVIVEGETSLVLIDTLDTDTRASVVRNEIENLTNKKVKTIIYTHGHPDHRGGAGAFKDTAKEIIAFAPKKKVLKYTDKIMDILNRRMAKQFGYDLTDEEVTTQGIGIREGFTCGEGSRAPLPPTTVWDQDAVERVIDGVRFNLVSAMGETDDQIFVWLPDDKTLCCGDNYYACWPNLYAIRGGQYRDVASWIDSLETIISYKSKALLPGHTEPLLGYENILNVLSNYKEAIESVLLQTLECMNKGMTEGEAVHTVTLPDKYKEKPYLGEYYGTVAWSVRAIYQGYLGWFDGNPANLNPLPNKDYAERMVRLIGGDEKVIGEIKSAIKMNDYQWALQLCDILANNAYDIPDLNELRVECLIGLSKGVISANARHYYLASAKEMEI